MMIFISQSPFPELYLLPVEENSSSLSYRSLSSDTVIYNIDSQMCCPPRPAFPSVQSKESTKFPLIIQGTQQCVIDQSLEDESSLTSLEERDEDSLGLEKSSWTSDHKMCWNVQAHLMAKQHGEKHFYKTVFAKIILPKNLQKEFYQNKFTPLLTPADIYQGCPNLI